ncbi:YcxB family protein [Sporolactobacillus shoreicorticis]|uniref:YcxB family protein n=1 Tax=Sporolactobacillus shoreicorticis TaxID=1923877 RepID=A0ABW5S8W6_9BACL|nr:YcxB family protein [Sporolactobacillus shoreicorticis]MCO7125450.1 YcxB family protein [Sporolactobacillus shoreicorticis]
MEKEIIKFGGRLTYKEFKMFNYYHSKKIVRIGFLTLWITVFLINLTSMSWIPSLIISSIIALLTMTLIKVLLNFRISKEFRSDQVLKKDAQFVVHGNGVTILREKSKTQYDWNDIISFQQYKELFLLYVSKNRAIIIPRRYFNSVQESQLFKQLMATNLSKKINNK